MQPRVLTAAVGVGAAGLPTREAAALGVCARFSSLRLLLLLYSHGPLSGSGIGAIYVYVKYTNGHEDAMNMDIDIDHKVLSSLFFSQPHPPPSLNNHTARGKEPALVLVPEHTRAEQRSLILELL